MKDWKAFKNDKITVHGSEQGSLKGLRFAVKDVYHIKGVTSGAGNPDWERTHDPAKKNADVINFLCEAGSTLTGLTHTDELMFSLNGENAHYGTPVNPAAPTRIPGGSSSGSAVAVAASQVDFSIGTDTGGSVRVPSSYCGIYGFRPSHNLVSMEGVIPLAPSFDTVGWMTRQADLLYQIGVELNLKHSQTASSFTKVIIPSDVLKLVGEECESQYRTALNKFEGMELEITVEPFTDDEYEAWLTSFRTIQGYEIWQTHGEWIEATKPSFGNGIKERFIWTSTITDQEYQEACLKQEVIKSQMEDMIDEQTLIAMPTVPGVAPLLNMSGPELEEQRKQMLKMNSISGLTGFPQVTLPLMYIDETPVGLSLLAKKNKDLDLLAFVKNVKLS